MGRVKKKRMKGMESTGIRKRRGKEGNNREAKTRDGGVGTFIRIGKEGKER